MTSNLAQAPYPPAPDSQARQAAAGVAAAAQPAGPADSPAATQVALAPAAIGNAPPAGEDEAAKLVGLDRAGVESRLGQPWMQRHEATAELWQYRATNCVLDVFLYPRSDGDLRVTYAELRSRRENRAAPVGCYGEIRDAARPGMRASAVSARG